MIRWNYEWKCIKNEYMIWLQVVASKRATFNKCLASVCLGRVRQCQEEEEYIRNNNLCWTNVFCIQYMSSLGLLLSFEYQQYNPHKYLSFDLIWQLEQGASVFNNDAKGWYDRIIPSIGMQECWQLPSTGGTRSNCPTILHAMKYHVAPHSTGHHWGPLHQHGWLNTTRHPTG